MDKLNLFSHLSFFIIISLAIALAGPAKQPAAEGAEPLTDSDGYHPLPRHRDGGKTAKMNVVTDSDGYHPLPKHRDGGKTAKQNVVTDNDGYHPLPKHRDGEKTAKMNVVKDSDGYHPLPKHRDGGKTARMNVDWKEIGRQGIQRALEVTQNQIVKKAQNVIFFLGDGMGFTSETAGRWYRSQYHGEEFADDFYLPWDHFPHSGVSITYNTDAIVPDSAGTATAFMCGEKAASGVIGVNQDTIYEDCNSMEGNEIQSILHSAVQQDKWTGIVTTARITHATPSAAFAHSPSRNWESSADGDCVDIAAQLIENTLNHDVRLIMGGGRREFLPNDQYDPEYPILEMSRTDGRNLIEEWEDIMLEKGIDSEHIAIVYNQTAFDEIDVNTVERVLGLFQPSHMQYELDRENDAWGEPSLTEMVEKSIDILERADNGYFLLVEGGRIDHANHDTNAKRMLEDLTEFGRSVQKAVDMTDEEDTLIIVTADHSHVLSIGGYVTIDTDILGYDPVNSIGDDDKPYTVLGYGNGPGYYDHKTYNGSLDDEIPRKDISGLDTAADNYLQDVIVPIYSETHGGEDVGIYARGPMSHLIHTKHEQSYIAHVMSFAACMSDPDADHCKDAEEPTEPPITGSAPVIHTSALTVAVLIIYHVYNKCI